MLEVSDIWMRKVVSYDKIHIPINKNNGFVVITGHNKDSRIAEDQNNGAGKSLLLSSLPNLLYSAAPMATSKNAKKEMLDNSQSFIRTAFLNNEGTPVRVTQTPKNWVIEEHDGQEYVDQQVRTVALQQEKIEEHFPISEAEFYSYIYIQSQMRLAFQVGKPLDRLKFITEVFHLDEYDRLKKYFTKMLGRIKDEQTKFDVIQSKLLSVNASLKKLRWTEKKESDLAESKERLDIVKSEHVDLGRDISRQKALVRGLKSLSRLEEEKAALDKNVLAQIKQLGSVEDAIVYYKHQIDLHHKLENYRIQFASAKKQHRRIIAKLEEIQKQNLPSASVLKKRKVSIRDKIETLRENKRIAEQALKKYDELVQRRDKTKILLKELGFESIDDVEMKRDIDEDMSICKTTLKLEKLLNRGNHVCPTCHQDVDVDDIAANVKKANRRLTKLRTLQKARDFVNEYVAICEELAEEKIDISVEYITGLDQKISSYESKLEDIDNQLALRKKIDDLEEDLASIERPKKPKEEPDDLDFLVVKSSLEVCNEFAKIEHSISSIYRSHKGLRKIVKELGLEKAYEEMSDELNVNTSHYDELSEEQSELIKYVSKMDLKFGEYRILIKQKNEYETEMEEIRPLLEKRDMYKALEQAYGPKGLKVERADEIVAILETNLNQYSHFIFAEPFSFSVYANEKGIHCEVKRGAKDKVSDVRLLSGAESDCFRLLFMLSMLVMVPHTRRTNFIVLDEPDSHMDEATREIFRDSFLPYLREVVPHIFLITPKDPHFYNDFEHWEVVKEQGLSKVRRV